jgi:hypothetical protein
MRSRFRIKDDKLRMASSRQWQQIARFKLHSQQKSNQPHQRLPRKDTRLISIHDHMIHLFEMYSTQINNSRTATFSTENDYPGDHRTVSMNFLSSGEFWRRRARSGEPLHKSKLSLLLVKFTDHSTVSDSPVLLSRWAAGLVARLRWVSCSLPSKLASVG